jgi:hypothetical protein
MECNRSAAWPTERLEHRRLIRVGFWHQAKWMHVRPVDRISRRGHCDAVGAQNR